MEKKLRVLTNAEEEVMQILWKLGKGFVKEILEQFPEPRPAYNTVSTIIRILEKKGVVSYKSYGKTHEYFPLFTKKEYARFTMSNTVNNYFDSSLKRVVSYFAANETISISEMEEVRKMIKEQIKQRKQKGDE